jgi:hypothetical protein
MLQIGRQGQLYAIAEVTYGVTPSLAASNALRHKQITMTFDNKNRRTIMEKKQSPGTIIAARTNQRKSAAFSLQAILRPSGTLNTLPECDPVLAAAFGLKTNVTLATTVNAGTGAVGGATLASATGLVVGDFVLITCPDTKRRLRQILTLPGGGVVTWAPNLPTGQQPADAAAVKGVITYKLTTALVASLSLAHYLKFTDGTAGRKRVISGAGVDKLALAFDANDDPMFTASGNGKSVDDAPAQPGGFTMVGGQPPSGVTGDCAIGNTALKFLKLSIELTNALWWRDDEYGNDSATELFRRGRSAINVALETYGETDATLYDLTEAGTNTAVFKQTGYTEGNCLAVRMPQVEFPVPDQDDPDETVKDSYKGMALESADAANDMLYLAIG